MLDRNIPNILVVQKKKNQLRNQAKVEKKRKNRNYQIAYGNGAAFKDKFLSAQ